MTMKSKREDYNASEFMFTRTQQEISVSRNLHEVSARAFFYFLYVTKIILRQKQQDILYHLELNITFCVKILIMLFLNLCYILYKIQITFYLKAFSQVALLSHIWFLTKTISFSNYLRYIILGYSKDEYVFMSS